MRILFMTHSAVMGGGELSLLDLAKESPFTSTVLFLSTGPLQSIYIEKGIEVETVPFFLGNPSFVRFLKSPLDFLKLVKLSRKYDLLYSNSQKAHFLCFFLSCLLKKRWVVHYRDNFDQSKYGCFLSWASRTILNNGPSLIIANSKTTMESLKQAGVTAPIEAVYNYTNFSKRDQNKKKEHARLFYPSRLSPWKGQFEFISALKYVKTSCEVDMIGEGLFGEKLDFDLQALISEVPPHVKVNVHGFQKDISSYYQRSSFVVHLPSKPEPFGRVIAEAISHQVPVIVSPHATIDGFIKDRVTGFVSVDFDPKHIAKKIDEALASIDRENVAARAFDLAKDLFSREKTLYRVYDLLEKIQKN